MKKGFSCFFLLFLSPMFSSYLILAQVTTATISGTIKDETSAVIPGVSVTVKNLDTGISRTVPANDQGRYLASNLAPGKYEIQAELSGFQIQVKSNIQLTVGSEAVIDFVLRVGAVTERIEVTGEVPLVDTVTNTVSEVVESRELRDLPLNGRSFEQLVLLQAGTTPFRSFGKSVQVGYTTQISVSGARVTSNNFLLDGTSINDYLNATPGSSAGTLLGVEALREFRVLTHNYSAEYGRSSGAIINAISRSGTNQLQGSIYYFHRNDNMDTRNFFDPGKGPEFKRNQGGFAVGGPIFKNRTFFFGNYELLRERLGQTIISFFPNAAARQGLLPDRSNPGQLLNVGVDPAVKPYLDLLPLPNGKDFSDGTGEFIFGYSRASNEDFFTVRLDQVLSDRDTLFGRFTYDKSSVLDTRPHPAFVREFFGTTQYLTLEETKVFSPTVINSLRFGFTHSVPKDASYAVQKIDPSLLFVPGTWLGNITFGGGVGGGTSISDFGPPSFGRGPRERTTTNVQNTFQVSETVAYHSGNHTLKMGAHFERIQHNQVGNVTFAGSWSFQSLQEFLTNRPFAFSGATRDSSPVRHYRQSLLAFFVHDEWRVLPSLTLNLGLRYEFATVPNEIDGKMANLVDALGSVYTEGILWNSNYLSYKNVAPRLGFAWDPFGNGKTSVRGGVGVFQNQLIGGVWFSRFVSPSTTAETTVRYDRPTFFPRVPEELIATAPPTARTVKALDPNLDTPVMYHWNLGIQREMGRTNSVSISYVGSHGSHLQRLRNGNTAFPTLQPDGRKFFAPGLPFRNPNFVGIEIASNDVTSNYQSLQINVQRRWNTGFRSQVSFTLAKSLDDGSNIAGGEAVASGGAATMDPDDRSRDYGLSNFNIRRNLGVNLGYELPWGGSSAGIKGALLRGWQVNSIASISDGAPLYPEVGFERSRSRGRGVAERPDLKSGASNNPVLGGPDRYFDPTVFLLPEAGYWGNHGRNTLIGPGFANVDLSLVKTTRLKKFSENFAMQFRAEVFNVLNRANFSFPQLRLFNPDGSRLGNTGRITATTTSSRQIQLGLKFLF